MQASASCRALTGGALLVLCVGGGIAAVRLARRKPEKRGAVGETRAAAAAADELPPREAVLEEVRRLSSENRLSGTDGCARAARHIEERLREWGLEVRSQEFDIVIPVTKEMEFRVEGEEFDIHPLWPNWIRTCTTKGALSGPLVYAAEGKLKDYRGLPMEGAWYASAAGPVVLLEGDKGLDWYSAAMLGAQAIIFCESDATNRVEMENKVSFLPANVPRFYCDLETGARLKALAEGIQKERSDLLRLHSRAPPEEKEELARRLKALAARPAVDLSCRVDWERRPTRNILAILEGTDPAQRELVLLQAHYDSVSTVPDKAPGAESSCGAATLLELAREFARERPARSVGFAFFSGHFESMQGAKAFFGALRKTHAEWLKLACSLEEGVLGTSALEGPSFFATPQASVGILACVAGVGLVLAWAFARRMVLALGAVVSGSLAAGMFAWGSFIPQEELPAGALKLPRLEEARLAATDLKEKAPDVHSRVLKSLAEADESISRLLDVRKEYERSCAARASEKAEKPELARLAEEKSDALLASAREACATLAAYEEAVAALRSAPPEVEEEASAALRAMESLIARDMSSARKLHLYLDALESLRALEKLGTELPERVALVVSLDLSSKADTLAVLFKGSFVDQHEKNFETTLASCVAPVAEISCAIADRLAPGMLVNCVVNPRGLHWTNYMGGAIATDNELAMLAGFPACCLASTHDARDLLDTPLDVFDELDCDRLTRQASFVIEWAKEFVDDSRTSTVLRAMREEKLLSRERFRTISARTVEFDMSRGMGVADKPVPGALMVCYHDPGYYNRQRYRKMIWGVREAEVRFADERGAALFNAIPDSLARWWNDKDYTVEAYRFDPATGDIVMAPDRGEQGAKKFRPTVTPLREQEFVSCVVFPCVDVSVFDTLDQRSYYMFTHIEIFDAETDTEPFRYGYRITGRVGGNQSYIEPCAVLFLEPRSRFKVLFGSGATGTKYSLINSPRPTKSAHDGIGYEAASSFVVTHTPFKMARDLWNLDEYRIRNLVEHGVTNRQVQRLHESARVALDEAEEAVLAGRFDEGVMRSREAWAFEAKGYPSVRGTTSDILRGVLFYLFLVLPFAYFTERLIFGFANINKQLLGFFGIFLVVFLLLALVHPAFGVTHSSPVVLLAFLSVALSLLVLGMIRSRFELELSRLQQRPGAGARADFSRLNAAKSAFALGINNMRRRKVRTGLTLLTLVALTFSVLSFTSMEPESQILQYEIVNLSRARSTGEGEIEPPLRLGERGFRDTEEGVESTGRIRVRDWLAVEASFGEDVPAGLELVDADEDSCVMEFRPGSGYAAYTLSSGSGAFLRSFWGIVSVIVGFGGAVLFLQGAKVRPYGGGAFAVALVFGLLHFMPRGSAAGGVAPAELDPLGKGAEHSWVLQFNPETRECMALVNDKLVRRFRSEFLDPPLLVRAHPKPSSLAVQEEKRGIPWKGFLVRQRRWNPMTSQALRYILDEFDPAEGHLIAPRAWWILSELDATATRVTSAEKPSLNFLAQGLVGMAAEEKEFTRPQDDLAAGRWFEPGEEQVCVLPQKIARACGIQVKDLEAPPRVLILGEEMTVVGITKDEFWSDKTDIDTEPLSPVDYTVENWMKHWGGQSQMQFYHYTHLSPLNVAYVPYSFLISRGGTLRSIAVKPKGGLTKTLKKRLLEKLSLPLFIADETKVIYASSAGARPIRGVGGLLVPMLICALIVLNTMLSAVYEREREIWIYGSLGLAPVHIGSLFMAESLVFAVMGTVMGYVLGQVVAKLVAMGFFLEGLSLNYSSSSAVFSAVFVMVVVLLSSLYPAMRASSLSVPDVERIWKFPEAEGDLLRIDFPFTMSEEQAVGVSMHLKKFFEDHADQSVGEFYTSGARLLPREGGGVEIVCRAWIAPFDFGISQDVVLATFPGDEPGIYEARMLLTRLSGEPASWERMNQRFLGNIRKQFLIWRLFSATERAYYLEEAKRELVATEARS